MIIPKRRGNYGDLAAVGFASALSLVGCVFVEQDPKQYIILSVSLQCLAAFVTEVKYRCCLLVEEWQHLPVRYGNDKKTLLQNAFTFSKKSYVPAAGALFVICSWFSPKNLLQDLYDFGCYPCMLMFGSGLLLTKVLDLDHGPLHLNLQLEKLCGLDYGASMAYSYYHGFLEIVLPEKGTEQKGVKELIKDFESSEGIQFSYNRLLVLIPMSLFCPPNLEEHSASITRVDSLGEIKVSRGGVFDRVYKNTVYKINRNGRRYYVCAEYATPLRTLHDIISNNNDHANIYKKHQNELVIQFYLTLKDILDNSPDCKNCCDLILFQDKTADNQFEDVGDILLEHLRQNDVEI